MRPSRPYRVPAAALFALLHLGAAGVATAEPDAQAAGRRMYREGVLPSGQPMRATVEGDVGLRSTACASCHRRSGMGSTEGDEAAPPVTGFALYRPRSAGLRQSYRAMPGRGERAAHSDETLARTIRTGVDPSGRELDALMPRYALAPDDMAILVSYLKSMSAAPDPGVSDDVLHLATIVGDGVEPARSAAMRDVLETFVRDKNGGTRAERRRAAHSPFYKELPYQAYRMWQLHVWELHGAPSSWRAQLERLYASQPVFGIVSGIAAGPWRPIHEFCESFEIPCLFPNTQLPVTDDSGFYTLYLSGGLALQAEALARYLDRAETAPDGAIVQVYREGEAGQRAAQAFRAAFDGAANGRLEERVLPADRSPDAAFWRGLQASGGPQVLILWLAEPDLDGVAAVPEVVAGLDRVFVSSTLAVDQPGPVPASLRDRVRLLHPFEPPGSSPQGLLRLQRWLEARGTRVQEEQIQADTYLAVTLLGRALAHIKGQFSRDFLIETLEHITDNSPFRARYPRVSLAPDQRFASKGCYVLRPSGEGWSAASDWIVP